MLKIAPSFGVFTVVTTEKTLAHQLWRWKPGVNFMNKSTLQEFLMTAFISEFMIQY